MFQGLGFPRFAFLSFAPAPKPLAQVSFVVAWEASSKAVFVSHQWLGRQHPDPKGEQVAVLRETLKILIDGSLAIEGDLVSMSYGEGKRLTPETRKQVETGYLFFDWFAIPQITARVEGVNEELTKTDAARAVNSIPSYVEAASLFVALVPFVLHTDTKQWCSYTTWLARGWSLSRPVSKPSTFESSRRRGESLLFVGQATEQLRCRAELWLHMLSSKPDTSVILITSVPEAKFMFPLDWLMSFGHSRGL